MDKLIVWHSTNKVFRYFITFLVIIIATIIQWLLRSYVDSNPYLVYYPTILIATIIGDGVFATTLAVIFAQLIFGPVPFSFHIRWPIDYIKTGIFLFNATLVVVGIRILRQSKTQARSSALKQARAKFELEETVKNLESLRNKNELILNSAGEGIFGLDLEGRTTFCNPAAAKMMEREASEIIGHKQHALLHHTKPNGAPYPQEECPIYQAFKDGLVHHVASEVFWRKDGTSFPVDYISTPIRENGELVGAVVAFRDITDRKHAEESQRIAQKAIEDLAN